MQPLGGLTITILLLLSAKFGELTNRERKLDFQKFLNAIINYQTRPKDVVFAFNEPDKMAYSLWRIPLLIGFFSNTLTVPLVTTRIAVVMSSPSHVIHSDYITYQQGNTSCKLKRNKWKKCHVHTVRKNDTAFNVGLKRVSNLLTNSNNNTHRIAILMSDNHNASKIRSHLTDIDEKNRRVVTFTVDHSGSGSDELDNVTTKSHHVFLIGNGVLMKELHHDLHKISANCSQKAIKHPCKKCVHATNRTGKLKVKLKSCRMHKTKTREKRSAPKTCKGGYCQNGGTCIDTATGLACKCTSEFKGETCQIKLANCSSKPCKNGGECIDHAKGFKCCCGSKYAGEFCEREVAICDSIHCFNGGTCVDRRGGYECKCVDGFSGNRCEKDHGTACIHLGEIYSNGTQWKEGCGNCVCENRHVTCRQKKCPEISCKENEAEVTPKGECCAKCVPESKRCLNNKEDCTFACKIVGNSYTCSCPDGMRLASNNRSCVDFSYCNDSGKIYLEKELWTTNCETCHCDRGEIICKRSLCPPITCKQDERQIIQPGECCEICVPESGSCTLFREGDINTFDGYTYSFRGRCRYSLSQDCVTDKFSIQYVNIPNKVEKRTIFISIRCIEIEISPSGKIFIEKERIYIPYTRSNLVRITPGPGSRYFSTVIFYTIDSITIIWKSTGDVAILVPSSYKGKLCGLCGNFNGNEEDDVFDEHNLPPNTAMDTAYEPMELCSIPKTTIGYTTIGNPTVPIYPYSDAFNGISISDGIHHIDTKISTDIFKTTTPSRFIQRISTKSDSSQISERIPPSGFVTKVLYPNASSSATTRPSRYPTIQTSSTVNPVYWGPLISDGTHYIEPKTSKGTSKTTPSSRADRISTKSDYNQASSLNPSGLTAWALNLTNPPTSSLPTRHSTVDIIYRPSGPFFTDKRGFKYPSYFFNTTPSSEADNIPRSSLSPELISSHSLVTKESLPDTDSVSRTYHYISSVTELGSMNISEHYSGEDIGIIGRNLRFPTIDTEFATEHAKSTSQRTSTQYDESYMVTPARTANETTGPSAKAKSHGFSAGETQDQLNTSADTFNLTNTTKTTTVTKDGISTGISQHPFQNTTTIFKDVTSFPPTVTKILVNYTSGLASVTSASLAGKETLSHSVTELNRTGYSEKTTSMEFEPGKKLVITSDQGALPKIVNPTEQFPGCPTDAATILFKSDTIFMCSLHVAIVNIFFLFT